MDRSLENHARLVTGDTPGLESTTIREVVPAKRRIHVADLRHYLPVIAVIASRDFKVKYKQSVLGPLWLVFQPLALFAGFLVAFRGRGGIGPGVPYVVFALSGLTVWSFFQAAMTIGTASLITNYQLIRFTPCPRPAFPLAAMIASTPSLIVPAAGTVLAGAITGTLSPRVVVLPVGFAWLFVMTVGIVSLSSSLAVRFRDVISVVPFLLSAVLFLAPVGYPLASLPHWLRGVIDLNPITGILEAFRWIMISHYHPSLPAIAVSLGMTAVVVTGGWLLFTRLETTMADDI